MIGLSYIIRVYGYSKSEIATKLKISRQTMNDWIKERRKIPSERIEQLSLIFKNIPKDLFQKELTKSEELEVQMIYLQHTDTSETTEIPVTDEEGNIVAWRQESYRAHAGIIDFLDNEQSNVLIMEKVKDLVADDEEARRLLHDFLNILDRGKRNHIEFLTELMIHLNDKMETLFLHKYEDLEQYLKKHNLITDQSAV